MESHTNSPGRATPEGPWPAHPPRRLRRLAVAAAVALVVVVLAVVFAVPAMLSSDAAARTASDLLTTRLGSATTVGDLEFSWGSGLAVRRVTIASPAGFAEPTFFSIGEFAVRPRVFSLFTGRLVVDEVVIDAPEIRVERREDGALNLPTLSGNPSPAAAPATADEAGKPAPAAGPPVEIEVRRISLTNARFSLTDRTLGKPLAVEGLGVEGRAEVVASRMRCELANLRGRVNDGPLTGRVALQSGAEGAELTATFRVQDARLGVELTNLLKSFLPILAAVPSGDVLQGKVAFELEAAGRGPTVDAMLGALTGKATLGIRDGAFGGSPLMAQLARALNEPKLARYAFRDHHGTFSIRERKFFNDLTEFTGDIPVTLKGWVDFAQQMDYQVTIDPKAFGDRPRVAKALEILNAEGGLRVTGPVDGPRVHFDTERVLKEGAKAFLKEAAKDRLGEAPAAESGTGEAIQKGVEGLFKRRKKEK